MTAARTSHILRSSALGSLQKRVSPTSSVSSPLLLRRIRQPLNHILPPRHTHNRHARHFPQPSLQIPIVRPNQVHPLLHNPIHNTIVRIRPLMIALESLPALVARDLGARYGIWDPVSPAPP